MILILATINFLLWKKSSKNIRIEHILYNRFFSKGVSVKTKLMMMALVVAASGLQGAEQKKDALIAAAHYCITSDAWLTDQAFKDKQCKRPVAIYVSDNENKQQERIINSLNSIHKDFLPISNIELYEYENELLKRKCLSLDRTKFIVASLSSLSDRDNRVV